MKYSLIKNLARVGAVLLGLIYLLSAVAKTMPVDAFTQNIFSRFEISWALAAFSSRFFIGLEFAIGILLLLQITGRKKWVLFISLALLLGFTGYLAGLWISEGSEADCGCMGTLIKMNPLWSILKNTLMILINVGLLYFLPSKGKKNSLAFFTIISAIVLSQFIFPKKLNTSLVYKETTGIPSNFEIRNGKKVVAFLSLSCSHCRNAASIIGQINQTNADLPFYFIFPESKDLTKQEHLLKQFLEETNCQKIPVAFIPSENFRKLAGDSVPSIYLLDNENIEDKISYPKLNQEMLEKWYKIK